MRFPKSFNALLLTQFLGALNDNLLKVAIGLSATAAGANYLSLSHILFILPFIAFSFLAGRLADRFPKANVIRYTKIFEIFLMLATAVLLLKSGILVALVMLFFMGLQSTFFSPCKYGIVPELVECSELSRANAHLQMYTFLAIILGTSLSGILYQLGLPYLSATLVLLAFLGYLASLGIKKTAEEPQKAETSESFFAAFLALKANRGLFLTLIGISFFWFIGSLFQLSIFLYADRALGATKVETSSLLAILAVGIGLGSLLVAWASRSKVELGLLPLAGLGLSVFSALLSLTTSSYLFTAILLFLIGLSSGVFIVPLNAYLQRYSPEEKRGRYIAVVNTTSFAAMLFAGVLFWFLSSVVTLRPEEIFLFCGFGALLASIYLVFLLPQMLLRCMNWMMIHTFYKVKVIGEANIPTDGGALFVANHVSFVDASMLLALTDRNVHFLMFKPIYELPLVRRIAGAMGAIPIAGGNLMTKEEKTLALKKAATHIEDGRFVGIFAEGAITLDGEIGPFKGGFERIMEHVDAPIIPIYLAGLWGSMFSKESGRAFFKIPRKIPYPVSIMVGEPLPADAKVEEVEAAVIALREAAESDKPSTA